MKIRAIYFLLAGLVLLTGCDYPDRYFIGDPRENNTVPAAQKMIVKNYSMPLASGYSFFMSGWAEDDFLLANSDGIVRYNNDVFYDTEWPTNYRVESLVCLADGTAWAVDNHGQMCFWNGQNWVEDLYLDDFIGMASFSSIPGGHLFIDALGRTVMFYRTRESTKIMRHDGNGWVEALPPFMIEVVSGCSGPDGNLYAIDRDFNLYHEEDNQWVVSSPFLGNGIEIGMVSYPGIVAAENGNMVVYECNGYSFWIKNADGWTFHFFNSGVNLDSLWWHEGQLFCVSNTYSKIEIYKWDTIQWLLEFEVPENIDAMWLQKQLEDKVLFMSSNRAVWSYSYGHFQMITPPISEISGVAFWRGQIHVMLESGAHLIAEEDAWRPVGWAIDGYTYLRSSLFVDDLDRLIFTGYEKLVSWDGASYQTIIDNLYTRAAHTQPDGSLLINDSEQTPRLGQLKDGVFSWLLPLPDSWESCKSFILDQNGGVWLQDDWRLSHLVAGTVFPNLTFTSGNGMYGFSHTHSNEIIAWRYEKLLSESQNDWVELVPCLPVMEGFSECCVGSATFGFQDELWVWEEVSNSLLSYGDNSWTSYELELENGTFVSLCRCGGIDINVCPNGDLLLWNGDYIFFRQTSSGGL